MKLQTIEQKFVPLPDRQNNPKIAIVGGGLTGLAVAYALSRENVRVTIFEKEKIPGGLASAFDMQGVLLDKYYHHIFESHSELIEILKNLGIQDRLFFKKTRMAYYSNNELYPLDTPRDLLNFKPLSLLQRIRLGYHLTLLLLQRDEKKFDAIGAQDYLTQHFGSRIFSLFWEPLLKNKFGDFSSRVSAAWLWDRIKSRSSRDKRQASGALGYLDGGFQILVNRLSEEIIHNTGEIKTECEITRIVENRCKQAPFTLVTQDSQYPDFDECVVTLPVPRFLSMAPSLSEGYINSLKRIAYAHSICLVLELDRSLSPFYWVNIGDPALPISVAVEHTHLAEPGRYHGRHIVYVSQYISSENDSAWNAPDQAIFEMYCRLLKKIFVAFSATLVKEYHVFRERHTQPIFTIGYSEEKPDFFTPAPGLSLVGTSQFYPLSRCLNTSFILAKNFTRQRKEKEILPGTTRR